MSKTKSDKEAFLEMLEKANIAFEEKFNDVIVERGYAGFSAFFHFDGNDSLIDMGAYE